jgi:exodeoxyribonuclease V alpha subunit
MPLHPDRLAALLAKARATAAASASTPTSAPVVSPVPEKPLETAIKSLSKDGTTAITLNQLQSLAVTTALKGKSLIVLGAAGTGKTTCEREIINYKIADGSAGKYINDGHKYLASDTPGIVCCAYTRRAVMNMKQVMPESMKGNTLTIHKLLEYQPVYYEVWDEGSQKMKNTMRFEATRHAGNPLPASITTVVLDEPSMVSVELFKELENALPHKPQYIFLGDIQQLPPVFGSAILGYKMLELPTIELTEVYRQALESPIIRLAHRILSGKEILASEFPTFYVPEKLKIHPWKKKLHPDAALLTAAKFFTAAIQAGQYNPSEDIILIPFNKAFGSIDLNNFIAQFIATQRKAVTYEIIAGFKKHYLAVGDKVLYDKEDAEIVSISMNGSYSGVKYQEPSILLDRWGHYRKPETTTDVVHKLEAEAKDLDDIDSMLDLMAGNAGEDRITEASHVITLRMYHSEEEVSISTASEVNSLLLGYVLTVHKSQGSEWRKVFLILHQSHNIMLQRELLYTACTRPREELYIICEPNSFEKGILSQRIKGNTLAEKAEYFKGKIADKQQQMKLTGE